MNAPAFPGRPRLVPGIPAGGVAALVLVGATLVLGLIVGPGQEGSPKVRVEIAGAPKPPAPPRAPAPPAPPRSYVDTQAIRDSVAEAMRGIDVEAIRREAMAAAEEARRELGARRGDVASSDSVGDGERSFPGVKTVRLVDFQGDVTIGVTGSDRTRLSADRGGRQLRATARDGVLTIVGDHSRRATLMLDIPADGTLVLTAFAGDLTLGGGFRGELKAEMLRGDITADRLGSASIRIMENGDVTLGQVDGKLGLAVFGRGEVTAGSVGALAVEAAGSSSVQIEQVRGDIALSIPGSADIHIGEAQGAVRTAFMGAGDVVIERGRVENMSVALLGNGTFTFNGTAVNPELVISGPGDIIMPTIEGEPRIHRTGHGSLVTRP